MSWSVTAIGTADKVKARISDNLGKASAQYTGAEQADIQFAEGAILAALEDSGQSSPYLQDGQIVGFEVKANGSRGHGYLSLSISVTRIALDVPTEAPAAPAPADVPITPAA